MPFPGAPRGFVCNATKRHDDLDPNCQCSACVRLGQPGLIEGAAVQTHPKFPVGHLVGLYRAEEVDLTNHEPHKTTCCVTDPDTETECGEPVEWNVWRDEPGTDTEGVVVQVCADHLDLVLSTTGRNVVWYEPPPLVPEKEEAEDGKDRA